MALLILGFARIESSQGGILDTVIQLIIGFDRINHFSELFDVVPANIEEVIAKQNIRLCASNKSDIRYPSQCINRYQLPIFTTKSSETNAL